MCSIENLSVRTVYVHACVRAYVHTAYCFAVQYNISNSFRNIPDCSRGHGGCSAASLGMLSQSRLQRQRLQRQYYFEVCSS